MDETTTILMHASVQAIIKNAERLLQDAKLLADNTSYRTAISLAVLSIEESGKACLVHWIKEGYLPKSKSAELSSGHIDKQRILSAYLISKALNSVGTVVRRTSDTAHVGQTYDAEFRQKATKAIEELAWLQLMTNCGGHNPVATVQVEPLARCPRQMMADWLASTYFTAQASETKLALR
jgi:AbiV family abortive infection protein